MPTARQELKTCTWHREFCASKAAMSRFINGLPEIYAYLYTPNFSAGLYAKYISRNISFFNDNYKRAQIILACLRGIE
jgi:hypothetical protein